MDRIDAMFEGIKVTTLVMRDAIKNGLCKFTYEDGTEVAPEDYIWDESQFPIEVMYEGSKINVNKQEVKDEFKKRGVQIY